MLVTHERPEENRQLYDRLRAGDVHVALRGGGLRISPHFYNDKSDIDRALTLLDG